MPLAIILGLAAFLWPMALGAALIDRFDHDISLVSGLVYAGASLVCHQDAARSFHTGPWQWPVCARCTGLYLAAPVGVVMALAVWRRIRWSPARIVTLAALPMAVAWSLEAVVGVAVPALVRALTAMPLGAALAGVLVLLPLARPAKSNRID